MPIKSPRHDNFSDFTKRVKSFPITQINVFDSLLGDIANYAYDTYDSMCDGLSEKIKSMSKAEKQKSMSELTKVEEEVKPLLNILYNMHHYDSKYMDRAKNTLRMLQDEIPGLIEKLKKN